MLAMTSLPDVLVQWLRDLRRRHRFHRELAHRLSRIDQDLIMLTRRFGRF